MAFETLSLGEIAKGISVVDEKAQELSPGISQHKKTGIREGTCEGDREE